MKSINKVLNYLNLLDYQKHLSLTNVIVVGCFIKLMIEPTPDLTSLVALLGALVSYGHKRHENNRIAKQDINTKLDTINNQIKALTNEHLDLTDKVHTVEASIPDTLVIDNKIKAVSDKTAQLESALSMNGMARR